MIQLCCGQQTTSLQPGVDIIYSHNKLLGVAVDCAGDNCNNQFLYTVDDDTKLVMSSKTVLYHMNQSDRIFTLQYDINQGKAMVNVQFSYQLLS